MAPPSTTSWVGRVLSPKPCPGRACFTEPAQCRVSVARCPAVRRCLAGPQPTGRLQRGSARRRRGRGRRVPSREDTSWNGPSTADTGWPLGAINLQETVSLWAVAQNIRWRRCGGPLARARHREAGGETSDVRFGETAAVRASRAGLRRHATRFPRAARNKAEERPPRGSSRCRRVRRVNGPDLWLSCRIATNVVVR